MAQMLRALVLLSALSLNGPLGAQAHMEMRWPYSFRSKFNPAVTDPDYDNTFPLSPDGSNFPCKGYQDLPGSQEPEVTYTPGQSYNLTLAGTATHAGGSCQISLSYDDGKTFRVIKSVIGGCPLKLNWDFTIPAYAPPSNSVILAWTWFNLIGNREMYMQCARVGIAGQAVQRYRRTSSKRQAAIDELPEIFTCNIGNGCQTLENHEVVFPFPGNVVEDGVDAIGPSPGPGYLLNGAPASTSFTAVLSLATPIAPVITIAAPSTVSTSAIISTITTPPFAMPNATSPGAFFPGTGTGTGRHNVTRTVTLTEFVNATSSTLISNSSIPTTTTQLPGGMFKTLTIISTLPPMPFLSGTTGTATPRVVTITQVVPVMPFGPQPTVDTTTSTPIPSTWRATPFSTVPLPPSITRITTLITSIISSTASTPSPSVIDAAVNSSVVSCTPGTFACDSATTFSECVSTSVSTTTWVRMGSVAAGMQCVDGAIVRGSAGPL